MHMQLRSPEQQRPSTPPEPAPAYQFSVLGAMPSSPASPTWSPSGRGRRTRNRSRAATSGQLRGRARTQVLATAGGQRTDLESNPTARRARRAFDGKECSARIPSRGGLRYGDLISLAVSRPAAVGHGAERAFVSTLQNPLFAAARLQGLTNEEITRPFALCATFEICAPDDVEGGLKGTPLLFGQKLRLLHHGSNTWLMTDPDKHATEGPTCASAFCYSNKSLDPAPKNGECRLKIMPKLKSAHENCPVTGNDQVNLEFVNGTLLNVTSVLREREGVLSEVNARPAEEFPKKGAIGHHESNFRMCLYHRWDASGEHAIKLGDVVRLFHAECEVSRPAAVHRIAAPW